MFIILYYVDVSASGDGTMFVLITRGLSGRREGQDLVLQYDVYRIASLLGTATHLLQCTLSRSL